MKHEIKPFADLQYAKLNRFLLSIRTLRKGVRMQSDE